MPIDHLNTEILNLRTIDILDSLILCLGDEDGVYPVHCNTFSNIPGLYSLDASSITTPSVTNQTVSKYCQMSPWEKNWPQERTNALTLLSLDFRLCEYRSLLILPLVL